MVGSRISGSSASPMRSVVWAVASNDSSSAAAVTARRKTLIALSPLSLRRRWCRSDYINPATACTFRATAEGGYQFFQHRGKRAIGRDDALGRRKFRDAMAGGGMASAVREQFRLLDA